MCEDVEGITADRVDDGQPVDLILDQRIHSVVDTGRERESSQRRRYWERAFLGLSYIQTFLSSLLLDLQQTDCLVNEHTFMSKELPFCS